MKQKPTNGQQRCQIFLFSAASVNQILKVFWFFSGRKSSRGAGLNHQLVPMFS